MYSNIFMTEVNCGVIPQECRYRKTRSPIETPRRNMNKYKKLLTLSLILLSVGIGLFYLKGKSQVNDNLTHESVKDTRANLAIKNGDETQSFDISQYVGKTALEATQAVAKIETSGEGINAFATGINGRVADSKKREFWELVINGKSADVGAGSYKIQNGDKLEWKLSLY